MIFCMCLHLAWLHLSSTNSEDGYSYSSEREMVNSSNSQEHYVSLYSLKPPSKDIKNNLYSLFKIPTSFKHWAFKLLIQQFLFYKVQQKLLPIWSFFCTYLIRIASYSVVLWIVQISVITVRKLELIIYSAT